MKPLRTNTGEEMETPEVWRTADLLGLDKGHDRERPTGTRHRGVALAILLSATFMQLLDTTIVNIAIPSIQANLSATFSQLEFVVAGYLLAFAVALLVGGRLGDVYGRKRLFLLGMAGFTASSALCGIAPTAEALIVGRLAQGLFSGLLLPQVLAVIQVVYTPQERPRVYSIYGAILGIASIVGPLLGGLLVQLDVFGTEWRMIFLVNVPVGVTALATAVPFLPESRAERAHTLDWGGAGLVSVGLFLLVFPLVEGRDAGWPPWTFLVLTASAMVLAVFVRYQRALTRRFDESAGSTTAPLVPWTLFSQRSFNVGLLLNLFFFLGLGSFFFYFLIYLQAGLRFGALDAGLTALPFAVGGAISSSVSDRLTHRLGTRVLALGLVVIAAAMAGLVWTLELAGPKPHIFDFAPTLFAGGLGLGLFVAPVTAVVLARIHHDDAGSASGALNTTQQIAAAIGVAIVGVLFFGLIGTNADRASSDTAPVIRTQLAAAGLPPQAITPIIDGYQRCLHDRSNQKDLSAVPASCRLAATPSVLQPAAQGKIGEIVGTASRQAHGANFTFSAKWATVYVIGVFTAALLTLLALPKIDRRRIHAATVALAADPHT